MNSKQNLSGNKSKKLTRWIDEFELMNRWHVNELELAELVIKFGLPIYEQETLGLPDDDSNEWTIYLIKDGDCAFKLDEVEHFESKHKDLLPTKKTIMDIKKNKEKPRSKISPKEAREAPETKKKLRPDQEDKLECQKIAKEVWKEHLLDIKYMIMHPDIKKIVGRQYKDKTVHRWLSKEAPDEVQRKGTRSKNYVKEQLAICEKLKIEVPKK